MRHYPIGPKPLNNGDREMTEAERAKMIAEAIACIGRACDLARNANQAKRKRYHVQVLIKEGKKYVWRRVHPVGNDPYVFDEKAAYAYVKTASLDHPGRYRVEELPE
jgi:hypothetical protein